MVGDVGPCCSAVDKTLTGAAGFAPSGRPRDPLRRRVVRAGRAGPPARGAYQGEVPIGCGRLLAGWVGADIYIRAAIWLAVLLLAGRGMVDRGRILH